MRSKEIRTRFLSFFEKRGHALLSSASLVTADEKGATDGTLFTTAGMQPLTPYFLGVPHPQGSRLASVQKCLRTVDIDDIGDKTHATFFEMLGNWSLGDYFKEDAIQWSYEFLTSEKEGLGLDSKRLYVTVFEGDHTAPRDEEAALIWREIFKKNGIEGERIFYMPGEMNWWSAGDNGPCGPDTEMYYDVFGNYGGEGLTHDEFLKADATQDVVEVWNDVFMQYEKKDGKIIGKLVKPSVDTGAGLERLAMILQRVDNIYDTDLIKPVLEKVKELSKNWNLTSARIAIDHLKAALFLVADGVALSNTGRGYVLRKLIRRAIRHSEILGLWNPGEILEVIQNQYKETYPEIILNREGFLRGNDGYALRHVIEDEEMRFRNTLGKGMEEFKKISKGTLSGHDAFKLFSTYGFPFELTLELAKEKGLALDRLGFEEEMKKHQTLSRAGAEKKFKGGLEDTSELSLRYHTATHLLHQALRDVLGDHVMQKGSNITSERLRFDFTHSQKMTEEEKKKVEALINQKIKDELPVLKIILPKKEAEKTGALHFFGEKYGDQVSIYYVGNSLTEAYSKEFCGGPHVRNTKELAGRFRIIKEEAISQGIRRIKALLES